MARRTDLDLDMEERCRLLDDWVDTRRQIAALEAHAANLLIDRIAVHDADVAESPFHRDAIYRSMIAEYAAAGHLPTGTVEHAFTDARTLARDLPAVCSAFRDGAITAGHVREIVRASAVVDEAVRNKKVDAEVLGLFEQSVLVVAEQDTAARTRARHRSSRVFFFRLVGDDRRSFAGLAGIGLADVADDPHLHRDDLQLLAGLLADHLLAGTAGAGALMLG